MKRWQKVLLVLILLIAVSQIPFAYRRYRLGKLHAAIVAVQSQPRILSDDGIIREFVGVAHVHSFLGGHSPGTFQEIVAAAQANQLHFVMMSEHPASEFNTAAMTLQGDHGGVLFINGNEVSSASGDRLLLFPGDDLAASDNQRTVEQILARRNTGMAVVAYPDDFKSWNTNGYQGIEIYNVFTNTKQINRGLMFFDALWSYGSYPDLLFARFYDRPNSALRKWDEEMARTGRRLVATAGNDAHANIGFSFKNGAGGKLLGLKLDPYERSFRLVRLHVLVPTFHGEPLTQETLLNALKRGNCFVGYDLFGDTVGFRFTASDGDERRMMGDEISLKDEVRLEVKLPIAARIQLLKDGTVIRDDYNVNTIDLGVRERGVYRVEVYLPQLPLVGHQPWIISNPIYVR